MPLFRSSRTASAALVMTAAAFSSIVVGASGASARRAAAGPRKIVTAARIMPAAGTLPPGSTVPAAEIAGNRVFTDATHGFALVGAVDADYAAATADGGRTWKTASPALHLHAAQAPLAVVYIGALSTKTVFAWGGGQVIDVTSDGGATWYRALFASGAPQAVVPSLAGRKSLVAFISSFGGKQVWRYVSTDGGRTWHYHTTVRG